MVLAVAVQLFTQPEAAYRSHRLEQSSADPHFVTYHTWGCISKNRWSGCKATHANQVHCRQTCSVIRPLSNGICFSLPVGIGNDSKPSVHFLLHVESNNMLTEHSFQAKMGQLTQDETERQTAGLYLRDL